MKGLWESPWVRGAAYVGMDQLMLSVGVPIVLFFVGLHRNHFGASYAYHNEMSNIPYYGKFFSWTSPKPMIGGYIAETEVYNHDDEFRKICLILLDTEVKNICLPTERAQSEHVYSLSKLEKAFLKMSDLIRSEDRSEETRMALREKTAYLNHVKLESLAVNARVKGNGGASDVHLGIVTQQPQPAESTIMTGTGPRCSYVARNPPKVRS